MRETCARVLAAALMTGAIATAMGLPTLFESAGDLGRGLTAPPSSLQRSVRLPASVTPARPARAERLVTAHTTSPPSTEPAIVRQEPSRGATRASGRNPRPSGAGRSATPAPAAPEAETRELTSTTPEPVAEAPASPATAPARTDETGHGKKKPKDKAKGKGHGKKETPDVEQGASAPPVTEATVPASDSEPDVEADEKEHGRGKGHDKHESKHLD